jgi:hypothetical protein
MTNSSDIQVFRINKAKAFSYIIKDLKKKTKYNFGLNKTSCDEEIRAMIVALYCFEAQLQATCFSEEKEIATINAQDSLDYFLSKQEIDSLLEYAKSACSLRDRDDSDIRACVCENIGKKD